MRRRQKRRARKWTGRGQRSAVSRRSSTTDHGRQSTDHTPTRHSPLDSRPSTLVPQATNHRHVPVPNLPVSTFLRLLRPLAAAPVDSPPGHAGRRSDFRVQRSAIHGLRTTDDGPLTPLSRPNPESPCPSPQKNSLRLNLVPLSVFRRKTPQQPYRKASAGTLALHATERARGVAVSAQRCERTTLRRSGG